MSFARRAGLMYEPPRKHSSMRKLKLQTQITIDGYMAGPAGEMDWLTFQWDEALKHYVTELTAPVDCILLGRKLAEGFITHWAAKPSYEPAAAVDKMNDTHKVVFSRTLTTSAWPNTTVAGGPLGDEVHKLKAGPGGDLIAYGGGTFVSSLLAEGLVDDIHLMVNPVALGSGMKVFPSRLGYELVKATPFACGIVALNYRPGR